MIKMQVHGIVRRSSSFNTGRIEHLYKNPQAHIEGSKPFSVSKLSFCVTSCIMIRHFKVSFSSKPITPQLLTPELPALTAVCTPWSPSLPACGPGLWGHGAEAVPRGTGDAAWEPSAGQPLISFSRCPRALEPDQLHTEPTSALHIWSNLIKSSSLCTLILKIIGEHRSKSRWQSKIYVNLFTGSCQFLQLCVVFGDTLASWHPSFLIWPRQQFLRSWRSPFCRWRQREVDSITARSTWET